MMKIIGICGGSGSGKTTLVEAVRAHLSTDFVSVISQDSYYKNHDTLTFEERCELNYDHPNAIDYDLFVSHLNQLKEGKSIHSPIYSYSEHLRSDQFIEVFPKPVVLVEGILIFAHTLIERAIYHHHLYRCGRRHTPTQKNGQRYSNKRSNCRRGQASF